MTAVAATLDPPAPVAARPESIGLSEALLARFDAAARPRTIPADLLDPSAAGDLVAKLSQIVEAVRRSDLDRLVARRGWRHRLLGADIEARLIFAVQVKAAREALEVARADAGAAARRLARLQAEAPLLDADSARLNRVAVNANDIAARLAPMPAGADAGLADRFERRRANLATAVAAAAVAAAQVRAAIAHQQALIDRFAEIETVLFPVWERHALGLAQADGAEANVGEARRAARALLERLLGEAAPT